MRIMRRIGVIVFFLLLLSGWGFAAQDVVQKITVLGNVKIEEGVIRGALKVREGDTFSMDQLRADLRSIFNLGYFSDVQVDVKPVPGGREILFIVVEKPSIKEVLITGNQKVKTEDIREKLTLTPRSILNLEKVRENGEQIRKLYFSKGYYGVGVEHKIDYLETNEAVISFSINEGPKGSIRKILFTGNKHLKSSELKKVMVTRERNLLSFITKTGILDEDILKNDLQLIAAYYYDHGYLDVKVGEPKLNLRDPKHIEIEIAIEEGSPYRFGTIDFKGDVLTTKEDLFKLIKIKRQDIYSNTAIRRDVSALTEAFANRGYANVEISPQPTVDSKNLVVHLVFEVEKKKQVSFERIQVTGNTKTRDKVIRRELQVAEGDLYSATRLRKSRDRLKRTGYFKEVEFTTSRGTSEDKINLDVKVEEAPTGALSFGVGYSSLDKAIGTASLSDRNMFGLGYSGSLRFKLGTESKDFRMGFTDPYFLGYRYTAGFDLYHEEVDYFTTYDYKITGGDLRFGKELTEKLRTDLMYKFETFDIMNVAQEASKYIKEQEGKTTTSALSLTFTQDDRDDFYAPSRGSRHSLTLQNAGGPLGGDNYFGRVVGETSWFFPLPLNTVLNLRGKVGFIEGYSGRRVPLYERFLVGGQNTIRGFEYGKAGPVDENEDPLGAKRMVVLSGEWIFPLSREIGLRGALFADVGRGWGIEKSNFRPRPTDRNGGGGEGGDEGDAGDGPGVRRGVFRIKEPSWRVGVGFGIRWFSPFGPINIDIGFNPSPKRGEKSRVLEFNAGTTY